MTATTPTPPTSPMSRLPGRRRRRAVLLLLLIVVPILEILVIIAVDRVIGGWPTFLLLVAESVVGAWFVRREGAKTWRALSGALGTGHMPSREISDAALVLVGGALILAPGFLTDVVGFVLILPLTRPVARRVLEAVVARRLLGGVFTSPRGGTPFDPRPPSHGAPPRSPRSGAASDDVIEGDVIEGEIL